MLELGISLSKSSLASLLHLVPKVIRSWHACGDYRVLNAVTKPDRYPIPYIHDITAIVQGKKIFTKLELIRAYHRA